MPSPRSLYDILNVAPGAEPVVIEAAYRALMKKYHPDQSDPAAAAGASAADINQAYSILRDPQRRAEYDQREWAVQQQAVRLAMQAHLPMPVPHRGSRAFGWSGWVVSLCLAGLIGLMATQPEQFAASLAPAEAVRAAAMTEPDFRSQPVLQPGGPAKPRTAVEMAEQALAEATLPHVAAARAASPPAVLVESVREAAPAPRAKAKPRPRRQTGAAAKRGDPDFLERQGYIY